MIDKTTFAAEMTILRDRFGRRDMTAETIARYLDFLDPLLSTEEFRSAAREVFNRDTFWPSPQRLLEAVRGDPKQLAGDAWNQLLKAAQGGRPTDAPADAVAALRRSGATFRDVETAGEYRLKEIERAFKSEYQPPSLTPQLPSFALDIDEPA